jgi:hypothetical protein
MYESEGYKATIQVCGGSKLSSDDASNSCWAISPEDPAPEWKQQPDMPNARVMPDSVLLPDGTVLYLNGAKWGVAGGNAGQCQYAAGPVFLTDLYDPKTKKWTTVGKSIVPRLYHSGAILLMDGSVISTGSEMQNYLDFWGAPENIVKPLTPVNPQCWPNKVVNPA